MVLFTLTAASCSFAVGSWLRAKARVLSSGPASNFQACSTLALSASNVKGFEFGRKFRLIFGRLTNTSLNQMWLVVSLRQTLKRPFVSWAGGMGNCRKRSCSGFAALFLQMLIHLEYSTENISLNTCRTWWGRVTKDGPMVTVSSPPLSSISEWELLLPAGRIRRGASPHHLNEATSFAPLPLQKAILENVQPTVAAGVASRGGLLSERLMAFYFLFIFLLKYCQVFKNSGASS